MSVTKANVQIKTNEKGDMMVFHASLVLKNNNTVPMRTINEIPKKRREQFVFEIQHTLAMSIMAHVYGDLIEPINQLATIAKECAVEDDDLDKIIEVRQVIADILLGNVPPPTDEGVIIKGN